ncbi:MAG TPA: Uma2 family endonuclease [Candidatus Binatia bacterium]|jgi:Uma2 family endonuclease|nr:Uma2 family endonuclease [Candidatus Binatia bacterium]
MGAAPATASPLVRCYTLEEFFALELPPGHGHYELIAGVLYVVPPPTGRHDRVQSRLNLTFAAHAAAERHTGSTPLESVIFPGLTVVPEEVFAP